jgi:hypothetical protein
VGQEQPAVGAAPVQSCGAAQAVLPCVTTRQPFIIPQVTKLLASLGSQTVPAPLLHTDGTAGQTHFAPGIAPRHDSGAPHDTDWVVVKQPLALLSQVSRFPVAAQTLPAMVHSAGGVGQLPQAAAPALPVQGTVQVLVPATARQPWASGEQVSTFPLASQNVPAWPLLQTAGLAGQVQTAFGKAVPHGSLLGQVVVAIA